METLKFRIQIMQKNKWKDHPDFKAFASFEEAKKEAEKLAKGGVRYAQNIRIQEEIKES